MRMLYMNKALEELFHVQCAALLMRYTQNFESVGTLLDSCLDTRVSD